MLAQPREATDAVDVNQGSDDDARVCLSRIQLLGGSQRGIPMPIIERIVRLRPFTSVDDMVTRVNAPEPGCATRLPNKRQIG